MGRYAQVLHIVLYEKDLSICGQAVIEPPLSRYQGIAMIYVRYMTKRHLKLLEKNVSLNECII